MPTTSSSPARAWPRRPVIRSCRCPRGWCSAFPWASASSGPPSASRPLSSWPPGSRRLRTRARCRRSLRRCRPATWTACPWRLVATKPPTTAAIAASGRTACEARPAHLARRRGRHRYRSGLGTWRFTLLRATDNRQQSGGAILYGVRRLPDEEDDMLDPRMTIVALAVSGAGALGLGGVWAVAAHSGFRCGSHGPHGSAMMHKFVDFAVNEKLDEIKATDEQRQKVREIKDRLMKDGHALHESHGALHADLVKLLEQDQVDPAQVKAL